VARGNERRRSFRDDADFSSFLELLGRAVAEARRGPQRT